MKSDRVLRPSSILSVAAVMVVLASLVGCTGNASGETSTFEDSSEEPIAAVSPLLATPETQAPERKNPVGTGEVAQATFHNAVGGSIAMSDGTQMVIPAGAFAGQLGTLTMTSSTVPASNEIVTVTPTYAFGPEAGEFVKPIRIYIPVTLSGDRRLSDLTILWTRGFGENGFEELPTTFLSVDGDPNAFLAVAEVKRFGQGAAGYRPLPASDSTITPR